MADDNLITKALEQIASHDAEALRLKQWVNEADKMLGNPPRFSDLSSPGSVTVGKSGGKKWGPGDFFNKPFSTVVRMILIARYEAGGNEPSPASVDDIHEAMAAGSFSFETSGAEAQKNSIRISLGKNSATFVRLPNTDLFGLVEWYGRKAGKPGRKSSSGTGGGETTETENVAAENADAEAPPENDRAGAGEERAAA